MIFRTPALLFLALPLASLAAACAPSSADAGAETSEHAAVSDIAKMTARGDGSFDVECTDGRKEIVSAAEVGAGRVCKPAVTPPSPFASGACTGTPMTEAGALARLGDAPEPVRIGSFVLAIRHRTARYEWDAQRGWTNPRYRWEDAPNDKLVAYRETGLGSTSGVFAVFGERGSVEVARDSAGVPFLRLVGEAANVIGPDTTRFMRLVSEPLRPWQSSSAGPKLALERADAAGGSSWSRVSEYGWSVQLRDRTVGNYIRQWWFEGSDITAIVTERCGQFVSSQSLSGMSPTSGAIGIYMSLD